MNPKTYDLHCCIVDTSAGLVVAVAKYELDWARSQSLWLAGLAGDKEEEAQHIRIA